MPYRRGTFEREKVFKKFFVLRHEWGAKGGAFMVY